MASYQAKMDDIFDEDVEEDQIAQKDWNRAENDIKKTGYRLGVSAGQEETVQEGFDAGYKEAVGLGFIVGRLQGQISGSLSLVETAVSEQDGGGEGGELSRELRTLVNNCAHLALSITNLENTSVSVSPPSSAQATQAILSSLQSQSVNSRTCAPGSVGEITDLLNSLGIQESSPVHHSVFNQHFLQLLGQYHALLQRLNGS